MPEPVSRRRVRPERPLSHTKLPDAVRTALEHGCTGVPRDMLAADLIRSYSELELFQVRLPVRDRRHGQVARLVVAVRMRTIG